MKDKDYRLPEFPNWVVYKSLSADGRSTVQGWEWPLPKEIDASSAPGDWVEIKEPPILCQKGFHAWQTLERAKDESGTQLVYEMQIGGAVVWDHEKIATNRARLLRLVWKFEPQVVEQGVRKCRDCGEPHTRVRRYRDGPAVWSAPDGHPYNEESWEEWAKRQYNLIDAYRTIRKNISSFSYRPVVPAFHGPFRPWSGTSSEKHEHECGDCGLSEWFHEDWEERDKLAEELREYDRWELVLLIQKLRKGYETKQEHKR